MVRHQKQHALLVESQISCLLGGINTIINVGDMILFAKYAQLAYYREGENDSQEYQDLIDAGLKEVPMNELPETLQKATWNDYDSGFRAKIFKDDLGRYIVAFRGTVTDDPDLTKKYVISDGKQALGMEDEQYNKAMALSEKVDKSLPDDEVIFVGHSAGGGQAAAAGTITGRPTYTDNSAGLNEETISRYGKKNGGGYSLDNSKHIIALNSSTDILSMAQDGKYFIAGAMSTVPYLGVLLAPTIAGIPQAAGKRTSLVTDKTWNPLGNHSLEPLIRALEKKRENPQINVIVKDV
jgi:hypothetical protein